MRWQLASTFAAMAMSACYEEATVPCPDGVLCPADQACTGNPITSGLSLCGDPGEVGQCANKQPGSDGARPPCDTSIGTSGVCENNLCTECRPEFFDCHFTAWTPMSSPAATSLLGVRMVSPNLAYAVGGNGLALTYDGEGWSEGIANVSAPGQTLRAVWNVGADVVIVGNVSVRTSEAAMSIPGSASAVWGSGDTLLAVGGSELSGSYDGTSWTWTTPTVPIVNYAAIWGWSATSAVAVGNNSAVRKRSGTSWVDVQPTPTAPAFLGNGVWGISENDFFVVGHLDTSDVPAVGIILHYANGVWSDMTPAGTKQLNAVWGASADEVYAVGILGQILRYDGDIWSHVQHDNDKTVALNHISGVGRDAMIVSNSGTIWRISP